MNKTTPTLIGAILIAVGSMLKGQQIDVHLLVDSVISLALIFFRNSKALKP